VDGDGDASVLEQASIAMVGYGNLGRPAALNLRDSGLEVFIGSREDPSAARARADGFAVVPVDEAVDRADIVWMALPDEVIPDVLSPAATVRPRSGSAVCFSSGYCLANDLVKLPQDVDVVLLAPRMLGAHLRACYERREGFYSFVSVEQDATGTARERLLGLAQAFGTLWRGALEISASAEATLDMFVEQTVGPYLGAAVLSAFEVGTAGGLPAEALALELYLSGEMAQTWQAFADEGFFNAVRLHGYAAAFGGYVRLAELDVEALRRRFVATLEDLTSGRFARRFQDEVASGSPNRPLIEAMIDGDDPLSSVERSIRDAAAR
jgi:ketol-acid reductoisomerase